jgi:hypothetical protein
MKQVPCQLPKVAFATPSGDHNPILGLATPKLAPFPSFDSICAKMTPSRDSSKESASDRILRKAKSLLEETPTQDPPASIGKNILDAKAGSPAPLVSRLLANSVNRDASARPNSFGGHSSFSLHPIKFGEPGVTSARPGEIAVDVSYMEKLCFSLSCAGNSPIGKVSVTCHSTAPTRGLRLRISLEPSFAEPWEQMIPAISPGDTWMIEEIPLALSPEKFEKVREARPAQIRIEILRGDESFHSETFPIEILPFNYWFAGDLSFYFVANLAVFVLPNAPQIQSVLNPLCQNLRDLGYGDSLDGYQTQNPEKVRGMIEATFLTLRDNLALTYINPPASFEWSGQKVRLAQDVLESQKGTCLDLSLLLAGILESIGLDPLLIITEDHAFLGAWLVEEGAGISPEASDLPELVENGLFLTLNSTTMTEREGSFTEAIDQGIALLAEAKTICSITHARALGMKPAF